MPITSYKSLCIILHKSLWKESSLIVSCMTNYSGVVRLIAQGARKPKSAFFGHIEIGNTLEVCYTKSPFASMYRLSSCSVVSDLTHLHKNYVCLLAIEAILEIYNQLIFTEDESQRFFQLLQSYLDYLPQIKSNHLLVIWRFLFRLTAEMGFPIIDLDGGKYTISNKADCLHKYDIGLLDLVERWLELLPTTATLIKQENILDTTCATVNKFIFENLEHHLNKRIAHNAILQYEQEILF